MEMGRPTCIFMKFIASFNIFLLIVVALPEQGHLNSTLSINWNHTAVTAARFTTPYVQQTENIARRTTTEYVDRTLITKTSVVRASRTAMAPSSRTPSRRCMQYFEYPEVILFYATLGIGCLVSLILIIFFFIAVFRMRNRYKKRKQSSHFENINQFVMSQQPSPAEVNEGFSENPMYDGQRSRQSINVLYGESEKQTSEETISRGQNNPIYDATTPDGTEPKLQYLSNDAIVTPSNVDDLYSEPTSLSIWYDTGNYERVKSFIQRDSDNGTELEEMPNSYIVATDNVAYVPHGD